LPGALLVLIPLLLLGLSKLKGQWSFYHPIRLLGIGSILFILFAGGVVVSVKIGGGSNLHPIERANLGDLRPWCRAAIHLQCASGRDTLSLWNEGAGRVVGVA